MNSKNVAGAKIWSHYLKKQRNGATIRLPEDLENTPFNLFFHSAKFDNFKDKKNSDYGPRGVVPRAFF